MVSSQFRRSGTDRIKLVVGILALAGLLAACAPAAPPTPPSPPPKPAATAAPAPTKPAAAPTAAPTAAPAATKPAAPAATAAPTAPPKAAGPAAFTPDPTLLAAARQEGKVAWYSLFTAELLEKIGKQFEAKTGVKVEGLNLASGALYQRVMQENQAGLKVTDLVQLAQIGYWLEFVSRNMLEPYKPKGSDKVPAALADKDGHFFGHYIAPFPIAFNPKVIPAAQGPKRYGDLVDPKYKGKVSFVEPSGATAEAVWSLRQLYGWEYFEKLKANEVRIFRTSPEGLTALLTGDVPIAAIAPVGYTWAEQQKGNPVELLFPGEGTLASAIYAGMLKSAPRPNAAKLFLDYLFSEEFQSSLGKEGYYAVRDDAPPPTGLKPLKEIKLLTVDVQAFLKEQEAQQQQWNSMFRGR